MQGIYNYIHETNNISRVFSVAVILHLQSVITGITWAFTFHVRCIPIVMSSYFRIFSALFLITFLSPDSATFVKIYVTCLLSEIVMSGFLIGMVLLVCNC